MTPEQVHYSSLEKSCFGDAGAILEGQVGESSSEHLPMLEPMSSPIFRGKDNGDNHAEHLAADKIEESDQGCPSKIGVVASSSTTLRSELMPLTPSAENAVVRESGLSRVSLARASFRCKPSIDDLWTSEVTERADEFHSEGTLGELQEQFLRLSSSWPNGILLESCWRIMASMGEMGYEPYPPLDVTLNAMTAFIRMRPKRRTVSFHDDPFWGEKYLKKDAFMALMQNEHLRMDLPPHVTRVLIRVRKGMLAEDRFYVAQAATGTPPPKLLDEGNVVMSERVDQVSAVIIATNTVVLGLCADIASDGQFCNNVEYGVATYFIFEVFIKIHLHGLKAYAYGKQRLWNYFDLVVVGFAICDATLSFIFSDESLDSFTIVKILRLSRLARLVRILRYRIFADLKTMIQGVVSGCTVLGWAILLFLFIVYVIAVVCRITVGVVSNHLYSSHKSFENVPMAMFTIFRCFTGGCAAFDGTPLELHLASRYGPGFMLAYVLAVLSVTMGVANLIMATFIDTVMTASIARKQREQSSSAAAMKWKLQTLAEKLWEQTAKPGRDKSASVASEHHSVGTPGITRECFQLWLMNDEMNKLLQELDIPVSDKNSIFDVLDIDQSGELEVSELVEGLMHLRSCSDKCDTVATVLGVRYLTRMVEALSGDIAVLNARLSDDNRTACQAEP
eukprot:TRINITY_DN6636_c0_g1_i3.p1 TRINITY_DN6636_c0_g1~~TRINITY_DN6636_c0_g1_i3.p1  ORF type:complete len:775 (+),score=86.23 TRINITY_DN6636_c0_g1_i3:295-2325(+)